MPTLPPKSIRRPRRSHRSSPDEPLFVNYRTIIERTGISRSKFFALQREGAFPPELRAPVRGMWRWAEFLAWAKQAPPCLDRRPNGRRASAQAA